MPVLIEKRHVRLPLVGIIRQPSGAVQAAMRKPTAKTRPCAANPEIQLVTCPASSTSSFPAGSIQYSYDSNGNVTSKTAPKKNQTSASTSVVTTYSYDALNRLLSKTYSDSTPGAYYYYDQTAPWSFSISNPLGRLTEQGTYSGSSYMTLGIRDYDPMGRVKDQWYGTPINMGISAWIHVCFMPVGPHHFRTEKLHSTW